MTDLFAFADVISCDSKIVQYLAIYIPSYAEVKKTFRVVDWL